MQNITYVTGNYGKYISVKEKFERFGIEIKYANIDIYKADVSKREEVHNMIKSILEKYKKID